MIRSALSRKVTIGAVSTFAVAMLATGGTTAAQAATHVPAPSASTASITSVVPLSNIANCKASYPGDLCWWVDANQVGKMHPVRDAISNWTTQLESTCTGASAGTWNDCASTLYNNGSTGAWLYYNSGYSGPDFCMAAGSYMGDLTKYVYPNDLGQTINDTISSNRWASC